MKPRDHDPLRLDVERFANEEGRLEGHWPLSGMHRLVSACHAEEPPASTELVAFQAAGERRRQGGGESHARLQLALETRVKLTCQRCLGPVEAPLAVDRWFHFVAGETQAAELDADSEEDVLAITRSLDLHALAEDELLLALPLVPRHEVCLQPPLPAASEASDDEAAAPNPFAVLAGLKHRAH
jgi:uncharacterized protein